MDEKEAADLKHRIDTLECNLEESTKSLRALLEQIREGLSGSLDGRSDGLMSRLRQAEAIMADLRNRVTSLEGESQDTKLTKAKLVVIGLMAVTGFWKLVDLGMALLKKNSGH